MTERASFSVEAMVRGYHTYKDNWTAVVGEELPANGREPTLGTRSLWQC